MITTLKKQSLKVQTVTELITRLKILSQSADLNEHENTYLNQIFNLHVDV